LLQVEKLRFYVLKVMLSCGQCLVLRGLNGLAARTLVGLDAGVASLLHKTRGAGASRVNTRHM
jgi:hypothetical protein